MPLGCGVIPPGVRVTIDIAFDEVLIISYGYSDGTTHAIEINVEFDVSRVIAMLCDDGAPFNPFALAAPNTDLPIQEREIGGLRIHLVRNMFDHVSYRRHIDTKRRKRFSCSAKTPGESLRSQEDPAQSPSTKARRGAFSVKKLR
ncbi:MAG: ATP-binding protein [Gammaproteobacteria bacterium]